MAGANSIKPITVSNKDKRAASDSAAVMLDGPANRQNTLDAIYETSIMNIIFV